MTWYVKSISAAGQISTIPKDDFTEAVELRQELLAQGISTRIEDADGTVVAYQIPNDGKQSY